jgi:hypothetical protein
MPSERMRTVIWWIYYSLFLGLCISMLAVVLRYVVSWAFTEDGKLTGAHILYGVAVGMMIFGLLSLCFAYLAKTMWSRITRGKG